MQTKKAHPAIVAATLPAIYFLPDWVAPRAVRRFPPPAGAVNHACSAASSELVRRRWSSPLFSALLLWGPRFESCERICQLGMWRRHWRWMRFVLVRRHFHRGAEHLSKCWRLRIPVAESSSLQQGCSALAQITIHHDAVDLNKEFPEQAGMWRRSRAERKLRRTPLFNWSSGREKMGGTT